MLEPEQIQLCITKVIIHTNLDGVGDGNAHRRCAQLVSEGHGQQGRGHHHEGAKQVTPEGQPQVALHRHELTEEGERDAQIKTQTAGPWPPP